MSDLIAPHGGTLRECLLPSGHTPSLRHEATRMPCWNLTPRQLCDLELLLNGGFSPLAGFMTQQDYEPVVHQMRLSSGLLWPIPIVLDVTEAFAQALSIGTEIALRDPEGNILAVLHLSDLWRPDRLAEAQCVYGTQDAFHPGVEALLHQTHPVYLGGKIDGLEMPAHYDFTQARETPRGLRERFAQWGWHRVVAFQTRNPMHRAHQELTLRAAQQVEAKLLIHPVVGLTRPGDIDHYSRTRCYQHLLQYYPERTTHLSLLPLAMRMGGPREAVWHAIIRKNYGCTHLIVGRDHAGPGKDRAGRNFYGPYEAQALLSKYQNELTIAMVPFQEMVYVQEIKGYQPADAVAPGHTVLNVSGTELRKRLREGDDIPSWFSYPAVVEELRRTYPPKSLQGFCVFFTGSDGTGRSAMANALIAKLMELGKMALTLLDDDTLRKTRFTPSGPEETHPSLNVESVGYVVGEIVKHRGIVLCALPDRALCHHVREIVSPWGGWIEVHISGPSGVYDADESFEHAALTIERATCSCNEAAERILREIERMGYLQQWPGK